MLFVDNNWKIAHSCYYPGNKINTYRKEGVYYVFKDKYLCITGVKWYRS